MGSKIIDAVKYTAETVKGAVVVLFSPNAPIPAWKLDPFMPARPFECGHGGIYLPVFRYYIYSGFIMYGFYKFILPVKPRHKIIHHQIYDNMHHHEVEYWRGIRQKRQDAEYFRKYNPLKKAGEPEVGGHH
uniref:NADH dehydrogenase [ubiquinone] 1 beta subcomplex subunit 7 n=1 Tax=Ascaris lumbricoides TaxID=6252 RepID=A0A0M3IKK4_ASCLU